MAAPFRTIRALAIYNQDHANLPQLRFVSKSAESIEAMLDHRFPETPREPRTPIANAGLDEVTQALKALVDDMAKATEEEKPLCIVSFAGHGVLGAGWALSGNDVLTAQDFDDIMTLQDYVELVVISDTCFGAVIIDNPWGTLRPALRAQVAADHADHLQSAYSTSMLCIAAARATNVVVETAHDSLSHRLRSELDRWGADEGRKYEHLKALVTKHSSDAHSFVVVARPDERMQRPAFKPTR
jgi:Caspase domain